MSHDRIIDGIFHPSVTGMTGLMPKVWLPHWYAAEERKGLLRALEGVPQAKVMEAIQLYMSKPRCTDSICNCEANKRKTAGGNAGTNFHTAIEAYLTGKPVPSLERGEGRAFARFLRWAKNHKIEPYLLDGKPAFEIHVVHPVWRYVGTFDAICYIDGILRVVDWKSSNSMDYTFRLQIAAYGQGALDTKLVPEMPGGLVLRCDKREKPYGRAVDEDWSTPKEMEANFQVFASLRRPYDFALRNGLLRMDA